MPLFEMESIPLEKCEHIFHKECLYEYIKDKINNRQINFKCPNEDCKQELLINDFKDILDDKMY